MKDIICDQFQHSVSNLLIRHKSILDVLSKLNQTSSRLERAIIKSVTTCGCIKINALKQVIPEDVTFENLHNCMSTHLEGDICPNCKDIIEKEMGGHLFYLAALCNSMDINLFDVFLKENKKINTLGKYNFR
jgi:hypothetical protein